MACFVVSQLGACLAPANVRSCNLRGAFKSGDTVLRLLAGQGIYLQTCQVITDQTGYWSREFLNLTRAEADHTVHAGPSMLPARRRDTRTVVKTYATAETDSTLTETAVAAGLVANPVVLVSEYFLKTTGEGLPPGPGGLYGATEGISYLVVVGVVGWSLYTKVKTGSGLPGSLLGAVEGLSYLSLVAGKP